MVAVRISPFGGMVPAVDDRLLPDINGALAQNTWLYAGTAVGLPVPKVIYELDNHDAGSVYRIPRNLTDAVHIEDGIWVEFPDRNTQVLRSQVVDDTWDRYYWASTLDVPRYLPFADIVSQAPALTGYILGVPQPGNITAVASGGASSTLKTVAYVQTFVSAYGEEGPPSTPVILSSIKVDDTVTITLAAADPNDLGVDRNLTKSRIYRTITGTDGTTTYFFVAEVPIATATYVDNATDQTVALNSELESTTWSGPPSDLEGWVSLGNGMIAGWRANELWFCEPYRVHSWPVQYVLVTEYPIVGLGVSNQTLVVCTEGYAYTATGINPSTIALVRLPGLLPCTSRGSIVGTVEGVYFSTPQGLALVSPGGVVIATKELIRKDKWVSDAPVSTLRAVQLAAGYFGYGQAVFGIFDINAFDNDAFAQEDFGGGRRGVLIDPTSLSVAFNLLTSTIPVTNVIADAWSNEIFVIRDGAVEWIDISDVMQPRQAFVWRSKLFQPAEKRNFQAVKIFFSVPLGTPPQNPVQTMGSPQALAPGQYGLFRVYADGRLVMTRELRTSGELWRLPSGFKADFWQFEIEAIVEIDNIQAATSPTELAGI